MRLLAGIKQAHTQSWTETLVAGSNCPYCAGRAAPCQCSSLAATHLALAQEMRNSTRNGELGPDDVSAGSNRSVWWACSVATCNVEWQTSPQDRTRERRPTGCPECARKARAPQTSEQDLWLLRLSLHDALTAAGTAEHPTLAESEPELARQWHPTRNGSLTAADFTTSSHHKAWWLCPTGCLTTAGCAHNHHWQAGISDRERGTGCPFCAGKRPCQCNSLAALHPKLVQQQWDWEANRDLSPEHLLPASNRRVAWRCDLHESPCLWVARPSNRTLAARPSGCPQCANAAMRGPRGGTKTKD